jgi:hypothetical protein
MKAIIMLACALFLGYMACFQTEGTVHVYAAIAAAGSLVLSLR